MVDLIDCLSTFILYQVKIFICLTCFNKRITNKATNRMCVYNMFTCIHINRYFNVVKHRFKNMLCMCLYNYESVIIIELLCKYVYMCRTINNWPRITWEWSHSTYPKRLINVSGGSVIWWRGWWCDLSEKRVKPFFDADHGVTMEGGWWKENGNQIMLWCLLKHSNIRLYCG